MRNRGRGWGRGLQAAIATAAAAALLVGCSGDDPDPSGDPDPSQSQSQSQSESQGQSQPPDGSQGMVTSLACWGDSLTAGSGGDGTTYPDVLAELTGLDVFNGGVPGERSAGIAAREGGRPAETTVVGGSIPAEGGVEVKFGGDVVIIRDEGTLDGTLMDVHGVLTKDQTKVKGKYTFTRDDSGDAVEVPDGTPFITDISVEFQDAGTIIWAGHNDIRLGGGQQVLDNIASMVAHVEEGGHYLVLGLSNGTGAEEGTPFYQEGIEFVNPALEEAYGPDHYLDVRQWLIDDGLAAAGMEATAQDETDLANDVPPTSLRDPSAQGHLNAEGYRVLAEYIRDYITELGWI